MTMAVGFHLGGYVMLAADTRVTGYLFGVPISCQDDQEKVHRTGIGLITGAGYCPLLEAVRDRFKSMGEGNSNDIIRIIREEREKQRAQLALAGLISSKSVDTGWIFTYLTAADGKLKLRMGLSHSTIDDKQFCVYESGQCCLIAPAEASKQQAEVLHEGLIAALEPLQDISDQAKLQASIVRHWGLIAGVIRKLKPQFPSISAFSQVGVHLASGHRGISQIVSNEQDNLSLQLTL